MRMLPLIVEPRVVSSARCTCRESLYVDVESRLPLCGVMWSVAPESIIAEKTVPGEDSTCKTSAELVLDVARSCWAFSLACKTFLATRQSAVGWRRLQ